MKDPDGKGIKFDGIQSAAEMLNQLDRQSREKLLAQVAGRDPVLAEKIRQKMFVFEDLVKLEGRDLQILLREVSQEKLVVALRNVDDSFKQIIFKNLSTRAAQSLREELEEQSPQPLSKITRIQRELLDLVQEMIRLGRISGPPK
jgi:flagellar motor switch protein FliG